LHLGHNNPTQQCRHGADWLESSFAEKYPGVLVDSNMSQPRALTAKQANSLLGRSKRMLFPLYSALMRPHLEYHDQICTRKHKLEEDQSRAGALAL